MDDYKWRKQEELEYYKDRCWWCESSSGKGKVAVRLRELQRKYAKDIECQRTMKEFMDIFKEHCKYPKEIDTDGMTKKHFDVHVRPPPSYFELQLMKHKAEWERTKRFKKTQDNTLEFCNFLKKQQE